MLSKVSFLISLLINSFLLATLLNFALSKRLFNVDFKKVQNWLGIIFITGIVLDYVNFLGFPGRFPGEESLGSLLSRMTPFYLFLLFYPLILVGLNVPKKLRVGRIVPLVSLILFYTRLIPFYIVYFTNDYSFSEINHVYTDPVRQVIIAGPVLYIVLALLTKKLNK